MNNITIELIFGVVQAVITGILGSITKKGTIPKKYIPLQNILIGLIAGLLSLYFNIHKECGMALFTCLAISLGVGGGYDILKIKNK